jgi:hypothetical protein
VLVTASEGGAKAEDQCSEIVRFVGNILIEDGTPKGCTPGVTVYYTKPIHCFRTYGDPSISASEPLTPDFRESCDFGDAEHYRLV